MRKIQLYTEYKLDSILKSVWLCNLGCDLHQIKQTINITKHIEICLTSRGSAVRTRQPPLQSTIFGWCFFFAPFSSTFAMLCFQTF
jgi:hypothetical protein